ncbi:hypothetical protein AP460_02276 [Actinobacillus pleuropneumoniae]|nr:hypothetical protein AP460_02276 [Actinobacillus pleuropneumoniae]
MKKQYFKRLIASTLLFAGISAQAEVKVLQDVLDRQVKVDVPAKRVVLASIIRTILPQPVRRILNMSSVFHVSFGKNLIPVAGLYLVKRYRI